MSVSVPTIGRHPPLPPADQRSAPTRATSASPVTANRSWGCRAPSRLTRRTYPPSPRTSPCPPVLRMTPRSRHRLP